MNDMHENTVMQSVDDTIHTVPTQKLEDVPAEKRPAMPNVWQLLGAQIKRPAFWQQTVPMIFFNWLAPWLIFQFTSVHFSQTMALLITASAPSLWSLFNVIRHRRLDWLAVFTVGGILLSVASTLVLQDPRLLLLKDGFSMLALAFMLLILAALPFRAWKAIVSYILPRFMPDDDARTAVLIQAFQRPKLWLPIRIAYLIGGLICIGEFVLRTILLYKLPTAQFLLVSPIIARSFTFLIMGALALVILVRRWRTWRKM